MNNPQIMEDKQIKPMRWLFRYTATVLSCTAIIVFGITAVSKSASIVTTSIGQNISTNDLIAYGNATTTGDHYIGGILTVNGSLSASSFTASSTSATNTITGKLLVTNIPTLAHAFATWDTNVANSNVTNASLLINPSSAASDTNLFGIAVNNNVKFMIDAEGDVFVNSLTATGTITQALANISTLSVENNATLGDAITDTVTFDSGNLIFTNTSTTTIPSRINAYSFATSLTATPILSIDGLNGYVGIGTTSPYAKLSVSGIGVFDDYVRSSYFTATSTTASSTFPYLTSTQIALTELTAGSIPFIGAGGIISQDNSNLYWDDTNNRLGIGGAPSTYSFEISANDPKIHLKDTAGGTSRDWLLGNLLSDFVIQNTDFAAVPFRIGNDGAFDGALEIFTTENGVVINQASLSADFRVEGLNSTHLFFVDGSANNVGIGTTSPYAKLSVAGIGVFDDYVRSSYFIATSTTASSTFPMIVGSQLSGGNLWLGSTRHATKGNILFGTSIYDEVNNRLGIGMTPTVPLDVTGAIRGSSILTLSGSASYFFKSTAADGNVFVANTTGSSYYMGLATRGSGATSYLDFGRTVAAGTTITTQMTLDSAGNFGIGTTSPYAKLSVVGNGVFTGVLDVQSTTATSTFAGGFNAGSGGLVYDYSTGNVTINKDVNARRMGLGSTFPDLATPDSSLQIVRDAGLYMMSLYANNDNNDAPAAVAIRYSKGTYSAPTDAQASHMMFYLNVAGYDNGAYRDSSNLVWTATANATNAIRSKMQMNFSNSTGTMLENSLFSDTGTTFNDGSADMDFRIESDADANAFVVDGGLNNVGIGTSSPYAKLSVSGIGVFDNYVYSSYFTATSTTASSTFPMIVGSQNSGGNLWLGSTQHATKGKIFFGNSAYDEVNNRMGIASSSPFATFAVEQQANDNIVFLVADTGTSTPHIKVDGAGITYIEQLQTGAMSFDTNAGVITWQDMSITSTAASGTPQSYTAKIDNTDILTVFALSNGAGGVTYPSVGVGTTTPTEQFSVADRMYIGGTGTSTIQSNLRVMGTMRANVSYTGDLVFANNFRFTEADFGVNPQALYLKSHKNTDLLYIDENGYMGIGTTTPGAALTVQGNALADAWLTYEVAEMDLFPDDENEQFEEGDLLSISDESGGFVKASQYENYPIVGVAKAVNLWGQDTFKPAMLGTFTVKVSTENGNIYIGDYLTKSSIPGVAMRANEGDPTVGFALEEYSGDSVGVIKIFINADKPSGGSSINSTYTSAPSSGFSLSGVWDLVMDEFKLLGITFKSGLVKAREFVASKISTSELCLDDVCIDRNQLKDLLDKNQINSNVAPAPDSAPVADPIPAPVEPIPEPAPAL